MPVRRGRWTVAAAAQARVVARMRERGHSLEELKRAGREGRLAFGFVEELLPSPEERVTVEEVAAETGLEPELIERILVILGTPLDRERLLSPEDVKALRHCARVLAAGFPLVAFLQLVRVYVQSMRRIADAEVRLFHLYVHEPLIRDAVPELEIADEMGELAADILPLAAPLTEYLHTRYLRYFIEQDVVGHMEADLDAAATDLGQVPVTLCFIDLTGFTRYTEEEGDLEALDVVENFVETVETTLPPEATIVKTIGDEVMVVSPDAELADRVGGRAARALPAASSAAGRDPLRARPSTATATTSAPTSTSPTASSTAPRPARSWSPTGSPARSRNAAWNASRSARSASRASRCRPRFTSSAAPPPDRVAQHLGIWRARRCSRRCARAACCRPASRSSRCSPGVATRSACSTSRHACWARAG